MLQVGFVLSAQIDLALLFGHLQAEKPVNQTPSRAVSYSQAQNFGGAEFFIPGEQQCFVWDTASQSTK